ncbi:Biosynthetic arginine decarboxylase [Vibrio stylophorae]|uniref:Biosynthetic arginine decarboxylase n=1 Tax=Vibrio stylophorae TaxID=659351 RepID=A0ABM8ZTP3_9VIBR|nr:biosynthetic arginine decarboxylase [Vibrio stylophorae]CAH0533681.1 Biosynthetic arginine decarboxylase [Vibrio stylophorae]
MTTWTLDNARARYNLPYWSQGYFDINSQGEVVACPNREHPERQVSLAKLAQDLSDRGVSLPVLVRFPQIIHDRANSLCLAFNNAIKEYDYENNYLAVYPIKVNQQQEVVEAILASQSAQQQKQLGLEAGSKPELMAVLAMAQKASSVIVCNGYKDREYIRLALIGEKLGHRVYIVLEKRSELDLVLEEARQLGVKPRLGLRVRLASQGQGKWQASGGEKSKFGLSASQVFQVIDALKNADELDALQLVHFHLGSQMANVRDIRNGVGEASRIYCELRAMGVPIDTLDVGGGLAVDYEGTRSQSHCSMNYGAKEYANTIVATVADMCRQTQTPMPRLISESGRNLTAHHAVLITDVIGVERYEPSDLNAPAEDAHYLLQDLWQSWLELQQSKPHRALVELYRDCQSDLAEIHALFNIGMLGFAERAWAEEMSLNICNQLSHMLSQNNRVHRPILDELNEKLADKFFINFSLFQSMPDAWGIDQVFPVMPLAHLNQAPTKRAVMLDITCDSDGAIEHYVEEQGIETTLPVPPWDASNPYPIGCFMVGAYQEILGDMHNLFGDTHTAIVTIDKKGEYHIDNIELGDTVADVMRYVHMSPDAFLAAYKALAQQHVAPREQAALLHELSEGLRGYTYLEDID